MPDWKAIEADFLATGMAYSDLAKKWSVPLSTVKKRAMRGKWSKKHRGAVIEAENETGTGVELVPKIELELPRMEPEPAELVRPDAYAIETRAERIRKMLSATDAMMDRVINALDIIKPDDTYALKTLIAALKDLREMQGLNKSALDIEEQQARIAKLKSETRVTETEGAGGVLILPTIDDRLEPPEEEP